MDVFLIPVGDERYELYCEVPDDDPSDEHEAAPRGMFANLRKRFREMLAEAERDRRRDAERRTDADSADPAGKKTSILRRVKCWTMRKVAETIAEQRLLWHMRRQDAAVAVHPEDMPAEKAMEIVRAAMKADYEKHRFWAIVNGVLLVVSAALVFVPGPNLVAYYLAFRLVGHVLSMRGASRALSGVAWTTHASSALSELRQAIRLGPPERAERVSAIAARLHLEHLAHFFERTAVPSA
jgi:Mitochondrial K+-H+ exchange-related